MLHDEKNYTNHVALWHIRHRHHHHWSNRLTGKRTSDCDSEYGFQENAWENDCLILFDDLLQLIAAELKRNLGDDDDRTWNCGKKFDISPEFQVRRLCYAEHANNMEEIMVKVRQTFFSIWSW